MGPGVGAQRGVCVRARKETPSMDDTSLGEGKRLRGLILSGHAIKWQAIQS